jgi:hypothetical protein
MVKGIGQKVHAKENKFSFIATVLMKIDPTCLHTLERSYGKQFQN